MQARERPIKAVAVAAPTLRSFSRITTDIRVELTMKQMRTQRESTKKTTTPTSTSEGKK